MLSTTTTTPTTTGTGKVASRINVNDPALAATLEFLYLRPLLESLPPRWRNAIDVGAHRGDVTEALATSGLRVLALEPQKQLADRIEERLADHVAHGSVIVERCAASDRAGDAEMLVGRASTVSTLEAEWTTVAFPEEFQSPRRVSVPLRRVADVRNGQRGFDHVGFAKVDVEGHELPALKGMLDGPNGCEPPLVVMFEANQRFAGSAFDCISLLRAHGYDQFDIIIRDGVAPIAAERFRGIEMPEAWEGCGNRYFYANIIAYHRSLPAGVTLPDLGSFMESYRVEAARDVLRQALRHEAQWPTPVHPEWQAARAQLRQFLLAEDDWSEFLRHPVCKHMFVRGRWGKPQDFEREALASTAFGRLLLAQAADPQVGSPRPSERMPSLSTNMLGMAYYLTRIHKQCGGRLPATVVEVGGGYGALASLYATQVPRSAYVIVDLPEMLAIQHYFLSQALPHRRVTFSATPEPAVEAGTITLVPASLLGEWAPTGELLISTFAFSEMPLALQDTVRRRDYFGARQSFLTGQYSSEAPHANWVDHGQVIGPVVQAFPKVAVERFHFGENYLLTAER